MIEYFLSFLRILISWPVFGFILIMIFKTDIKNIMQGANRFSAWGLTWERIMQRAAPSEKIETVPKMPTEYRLDRFANVFWAGHDLVWTASSIMINLDRIIIAHGIKQTLFHLEKIGFQKNPAHEELSEINKEFKKLPASSWDFETRKKYAERLLGLRDTIGAEISKYQKDYAKMPLDRDIIPLIARAAK